MGDLSEGGGTRVVPHLANVHQHQLQGGGAGGGGRGGVTAGQRGGSARRLERG